MDKVYAEEIAMFRSTIIVILLAITPSITTARQWPIELAARRCEFDSALTLLNEGKTDVAPEDRWDYGILHARLLLQLERAKDALAVLRTLPAPKTNGQKADFFFVNGMALGLDGDLLPALESLNKARVAGVDKSLIDGAVGMAYLAAGKIADAERALLRALKSDPSLSGVLYNLGCLRARQGRIGEAAALVRQAWHLGFRNPLKIATDPDLAPLRTHKDLVGDLVASDERACMTF